MEKRLENLKTDMERYGFAKGTCYTYGRHVKLFIEHFDRPPADLHSRDIETFLDRLVEEGRPLGYRQHALIALRFFYCVTLERPEIVASVLTPSEETAVPEPLSPECLDRFFLSVHSPVYRTILQTALGCGMRVADADRGY